MGQTLKEGVNQGFWRLHVIRRAFSWSVPVFSEVASFCNNTFFFGVASVVNGFYHLRQGVLTQIVNSSKLFCDVSYTGHSNQKARFDFVRQLDKNMQDQKVNKDTKRVDELCKLMLKDNTI